VHVDGKRDQESERVDERVAARVRELSLLARAFGRCRDHEPAAKESVRFVHPSCELERRLVWKRDARLRGMRLNMGEERQGVGARSRR
jgi:hypothetical protein